MSNHNTVDDIINDDFLANNSNEAIKQQLRSLIESEVIGEDEAPKPNPKANNVRDRIGTCWICYENDVCYHETNDELRADQRKALNNIFGGSDE